METEKKEVKEQTDVKTETKVEKSQTDVKPETEAKLDETAYTEATQANKKFDEKLDDDNSVETTSSDEEKSEPENKESADDKDSGDKGKEDEGGETESDSLEISDELKQRIEDCGLDDEQVAKFKDVEALETMLDILESRQEKVVDETPETPDAKVEDDKPFDCGLKLAEDGSEYDPALIKTLNKIGGEFTAKIKTLENTINELVAEKQQAQSKSATEQIDKQFASLGEDFKEILGEGDASTIAKGSKFFKNRAAVVTEMRALKFGYEKVGKQVDIDKLFQRAITNLYPDKMKQLALKPTTDKLKARASQTVGRGSAPASTKTALERAIQANKDFDKKLQE